LCAPGHMSGDVGLEGSEGRTESCRLACRCNMTAKNAAAMEVMSEIRVMGSLYKSPMESKARLKLAGRV